MPTRLRISEYPKYSKFIERLLVLFLLVSSFDFTSSLSSSVTLPCELVANYIHTRCDTLSHRWQCLLLECSGESFPFRVHTRPTIQYFPPVKKNSTRHSHPPLPRKLGGSPKPGVSVGHTKDWFFFHSFMLSCNPNSNLPNHNPVHNVNC